MRAAFSAALLAMAACGASDDVTQGAGADIVAGAPSTSNEDAVVHLFVRAGDTHTGFGCTGTLLAPNVVLTAYHCVGVPSQTLVKCATRKGDYVESVSAFEGTLVDARQVFVVSARRRPSDLIDDADARAAKIIVEPVSGALCGQDIALLVLDKPVQDGKPATVRGTPAKKGELLTAVGWGEDEDGRAPSERMHKTGNPVEALEDESLSTTLADGQSQTYVDGPSEFTTLSVLCHGDSGGPMLDVDGRVVGVASRILPNDCGHGVSVYTDVSAHLALVRSALAAPLP